jgi:hypothetical protein
MTDLRYGLRTFLWTCAAFGSFLVLVAMIEVFIIGNRPTQTIFNVEVQTERLDVEIANVLPFQWSLREVDLVEGSGEPLTLTKPMVFTGSLRIDPPSKVQIERIVYGPLTIDVESAGRASVGQWYENDEPSRPAGRVVRVTIPNLPQRVQQGDRVLLPLGGRVTTGRVIGSETGATTSLLRSGRVTMLVRPIFYGEMFEAGDTTLAAGDYFGVPGSDVGREPDAVGFFVADERPGLTAAYRVVGLAGQVTRPGGSQFTVAAPLYSRFFHDSLLQGVVQTIASILAVASSLLGGFEAYRAVAERRGRGNAA